MELNEYQFNDYQIDRIIDIVNDYTNTDVSKIDSIFLLYGRDQVDVIVELLLDSPYLMGRGEFGLLFEIYLWNKWDLSTDAEDMEIDEINIQFSYYQQYIHNKLMRISDYFVEIQFFEGCANIKKILDVLSLMKASDLYENPKDLINRDLRVHLDD